MEIYAQDRVLEQYAAHLPADPEFLRRASMQEGARIVQLPTQNEVLLDVLDLSTTNTTGTFKSWLICLAVARCLRRETPVVLAQSSGNTANALAAYAAHTGLRAVILHPSASHRRIVPRLAETATVHFVEIDATEQQIKTAMAQCAEALDVPVTPTLDEQIEANKLRAYLLRDAGRELDRRWDWHIQALSSGYGPIGFYHGLREIRQSAPDAVHVPRFLGVQQEAVAPFARALGGEPDMPDQNAEMIEPTLFRRTLTEDLVHRMRDLRDYSGGAVRALTNVRYLQLEPRAISLLQDAGVAVARDDADAPRERAGVYALAGTLDAIERGLIRPGERALAVFTGGSAPSPFGTYRPHWRADQHEAHEVIARAIAKLRS